MEAGKVAEFDAPQTLIAAPEGIFAGFAGMRYHRSAKFAQKKFRYSIFGRCSVLSLSLVRGLNCWIGLPQRRPRAQSHVPVYQILAQSHNSNPSAALQYL